MPTKTMKYQIIKPLNQDWDTLGSVLNDVQYQSWKFSNYALQMYWDANNFNYAYKKRFGESIGTKDNPLPNGYKQFRGDILNEQKEVIDKISSNGKDALAKMVEDKWKIDYPD